jgi:hypothetical protein
MAYFSQKAIADPIRLSRSAHLTHSTYHLPNVTMKNPAKNLSLVTVLAVVLLSATSALAYGVSSYLLPAQQTSTSNLQVGYGDQVTVEVGGCGMPGPTYLSCRITDDMGHEVAFAMGATCSLHATISDTSSHKLQVSNLTSFAHKVCIVSQVSR